MEIKCQGKLNIKFTDSLYSSFDKCHVLAVIRVDSNDNLKYYYIDEIGSIGDKMFQNKAVEYIKNGRIDFKTIEDNCGEIIISFRKL